MLPLWETSPATQEQEPSLPCRVYRGWRANTQKQGMKVGLYCFSCVYTALITPLLSKWAPFACCDGSLFLVVVLQQASRLLRRLVTHINLADENPFRVGLVAWKFPRPSAPEPPLRIASRTRKVFTCYWHVFYLCSDEKIEKKLRLWEVTCSVRSAGEFAPFPLRHHLKGGM